MSKGIWVAVYEKIENMETLKKYAVKATAAINKYSGKFLVRGGQNIVTEGRKFVRTVVLEFSSFEKTKEFFYSAEYQAAHELLKDTVVRNHQIIEGN